MKIIVKGTFTPAELQVALQQAAVAAEACGLQKAARVAVYFSAVDEAGKPVNLFDPATGKPIKEGDGITITGYQGPTAEDADK